VPGGFAHNLQVLSPFPEPQTVRFQPLRSAVSQLDSPTSWAALPSPGAAAANDSWRVSAGVTAAGDHFGLRRSAATRRVSGDGANPERGGALQRTAEGSPDASFAGQSRNLF